MNDYNGSVAQLDINITTDVQISAVPGKNFYNAILYVTNRTSATEPLIVTKTTYTDLIDESEDISKDTDKALIESNLASLFKYSKPTVYIITPSLYSDYKLYGYFVYLDLKWDVSTSTSEDESETSTSSFSLDADDETLLETLKGKLDTDFSDCLVDLPVDYTTQASGSDTSGIESALDLIKGYSLDCNIFARAASVSATDDVFKENDSVIGLSPALYQLGRALGVANGSGVPVGNSFDMVAMAKANVLPTADTSTDVISAASAVYAAYYEGANINYFKPIGNGTGQLTNYGGWSSEGNCIAAKWLVAYINFINRVKCANAITTGKAFKNADTYDNILIAIRQTLSTMADSGRLTDVTLTAPSFSELPESDGDTITVPDAWEAVYVDNVRKVNISGTLVINA